LKLFIKLLVSLLVGAVCVWFALKKINLRETLAVLRALPLAAVAIYVATMVTTHFFRA
jgi:hypothetical protein